MINININISIQHKGTHTYHKVHTSRIIPPKVCTCNTIGILPKAKVKLPFSTPNQRFTLLWTMVVIYTYIYTLQKKQKRTGFAYCTYDRVARKIHTAGRGEQHNGAHPPKLPVGGPEDDANLLFLHIGRIPHPYVAASLPIWARSNQRLI